MVDITWISYVERGLKRMQQGAVVSNQREMVATLRAFQARLFLQHLLLFQ